jgi:hypothetical protein
MTDGSVKKESMMEEIRGIPELSGFAIPTTVDELEEIVALLPDDMRSAATPDKPHIIAINRRTREIAISRPCTDGTWDVTCVAYDPSASSTH